MATPNFLLTPQQQELLFAALNANRPTTENSLTLAPTSLDGSPVASKSVHDNFQDSSYLDYGSFFDPNDASIDFSLDNVDTSLIDNGDGSDGIDIDGANDDTKTESSPSTTSNDSPDKRGHPDDDDDDLTSAKRRESGDKVPKKPGRKPLTSEPSSKRKAQNRAAQRAFRERKEKHVKDLETKVAELEKASEAANSENGLLRARVEKMSAELSVYKKRLSALTSSVRTSPSSSTAHPPFGHPIFSNINDVNFQFEFPKFGQLPGPTPTTSTDNSPSAALSAARASEAVSPTNAAGASAASQRSPQDTTSAAQSQNKSVAKDDLSKLSNAFTPPISNGNGNTSRQSTGSTTTSSPSVSYHSNTAPSSSCGTSPEPYNQSPTATKPLDTLTTIGEEQPVVATNAMTDADLSLFGDANTGDISWLKAQSSFSFNPQLFGDYRDPQENILSGGGFDESLGNDLFDIDFITPFNTAVVPGSHKNDLISQIDAAKEAEFASSSIKPDYDANDTTLPGSTYLTCNKIWERLQTCPNVQSGDFDLDGLCSDLQKKAKCSGSGAVVDEHDFRAVMKKYLDKGDGDQCIRNVTASIVRGA